MAEPDEILSGLAEAGKALVKAPWEIAKAVARLAKKVVGAGD